MTHNFKHIIVKREDNLTCLCYPEKKPVEPNYSGYHPENLYEIQIAFEEGMKAWEESVVRIPMADDHKLKNYIFFQISNTEEYGKKNVREILEEGVSINPELVEIREVPVGLPVTAMTDKGLEHYENTQKFAYLSSPKEEKAEKTHKYKFLKLVNKEDNTAWERIKKGIDKRRTNKLVEEVKEEESEDQLIYKLLDIWGDRMKSRQHRIEIIKTKFNITRK